MKDLEHTKSIFSKVCNDMIGEECVDEYRFHPTRKWRIDHAFLSVKLAVEEEGGVFTFGRHTRGAGFVKDLEKYNMLIECGWRLLRYQPTKIDYEQIKRVYNMLKTTVD